MVLNLKSKISGQIYLLTAIIIFAASSPVVRKLTDIGAENLVNGQNPISFCSVILVGNICALITLLSIYNQQINWQSLQQLSRTDWLGLLSTSFLSGALAPALIFKAIELTLVDNVILIGRIEPPLILFLSTFFLKERVNFWATVGAIIAFLGVTITIFLQSPGEMMVEMIGLQIGTGELMAAFGAVAFAVSTIISKVTLRQVPLGIYCICRTATATLIFFTIFVLILEPDHLIYLFSPFVWKWISLYGVVIVVGGQLCWFKGLRNTDVAEISLAGSFTPIAGIIATYFLLGEIPTSAQYIGGSVIILGIVFNQIGIMNQSLEDEIIPEIESKKEIDLEVGFKGI